MGDIQLNNGEILSGEKIDKLVVYIINKFAEEKLSAEEAKIILNAAGDAVDGYSKVQGL